MAVIYRAYVCSQCGKLFRSHIVTVTAESRKNKRGRIAWGRDAVCENCLKSQDKNTQKNQ